MAVMAGTDSPLASSDARPHVVIAGGGVAALEAVLTFNEKARARLRLTMLAADSSFHYLPLAVTEAFSGGHAYRLALSDILDRFDTELIVDSLVGVDCAARRLRTAHGPEADYDALLVAIGARRRGTLPGAITFAGDNASVELRSLLHRAAEGRLKRLVYAVPPGVRWTLPAYELALITAGHFEQHSIPAEVAVATHESEPLAVFGGQASETIAAHLRMRGVGFHQVEVERFEPGKLIVAGAGALDADAVIALPRLFAPEIDGLPSDAHGFLPVDDFCRVPSVGPVYGAGDATSTPLKQGGVAAQQAETAAEAIIADLGLGPRPRPFKPRLRGLMLAGPPPRYRRLDPDALPQASGQGAGAGSAPRAKIAGRRLAAFLARQGIPLGAPPDTVALELEAEETSPSD